MRSVMVKQIHYNAVDHISTDVTEGAYWRPAPFVEKPGAMFCICRLCSRTRLLCLLHHTIQPSSKYSL
jgi:hypothetical protein